MKLFLQYFDFFACSNVLVRLFRMNTQKVHQKQTLVDWFQVMLLSFLFHVDWNSLQLFFIFPPCVPVNLPTVKLDTLYSWTFIHVNFCTSILYVIFSCYQVGFEHSHCSGSRLLETIFKSMYFLLALFSLLPIFCAFNAFCFCGVWFFFLKFCRSLITSFLEFQYKTIIILSLESNTKLTYYTMQNERNKLGKKGTYTYQIWLPTSEEYLFFSFFFFVNLIVQFTGWD